MKKTTRDILKVKRSRVLSKEEKLQMIKNRTSKQSRLRREAINRRQIRAFYKK